MMIDEYKEGDTIQLLIAGTHIGAVSATSECAEPKQRAVLCWKPQTSSMLRTLCNGFRK